jgi:hypothetical protein
MRVVAVLPLVLLAPASMAAAPSARPAISGDSEVPPGDTAQCDPLDQVRRADNPSEVRAQRLDRLPAGSLDLAVSRQFAGCPESVTVADNFGTIEGPRAVRPHLRQPAPPRARLLGR